MNIDLLTQISTNGRYTACIIWCFFFFFSLPEVTLITSVPTNLPLFLKKLHVLKQTAQQWIKHARHWTRYSLLSIHWQERILTSLTGAMGLPKSLWSSLTCNSCNACACWGLGMKMITSQSCSDASHASVRPTDAVKTARSHINLPLSSFFFISWHQRSTSVITAD